MTSRLGTGVALGFLLIISSNLLAGFCYPLQKLALEGLPPATITLVRTCIGLVPMAILVGRRGIDLASYTTSERWRLLLLGTLAYATPMLLGVVGTDLSTASNASILILLEPATIVVAAWLLLRERIGPAKLAGLCLGLFGALVIVMEGASLSDLLVGEHFTGNLILVVHAILWGFYTPIAKPIIARHAPIEVTLFTFVCAIPPLIPFAALEWNEWTWGTEAFHALLWCVVLGIFISFLATIFWVASLRYLQASAVAPFVFLQPFAGVLLGTLALGETLTPFAVGGGALIALGVLVAMRSRAAGG